MRLLQLQELIASLVRKYEIEPSKKNLRRILVSGRTLPQGHVEVGELRNLGDVPQK